MVAGPDGRITENYKLMPENNSNKPLTDLAFSSLALAPEVQAGLQSAGFTHATPIQSLTLPFALEGKDVAGQAQTGTGKTAAFLLTIFQRLIESPRGHPVIVEDGALISHKACLHGARVESNALVGIGAIVLDGAVIRAGALVGAGAIVTPGTEVPAGMLVLGQPAKPVRRLTPEESETIQAQVEELHAKAAEYRAVAKACGPPA